MGFCFVKVNFGTFKENSNRIIDSYESIIFIIFIIEKGFVSQPLNVTLRQVI